MPGCETKIQLKLFIDKLACWNAGKTPWERATNRVKVKKEIFSN